MKTISKLTIFKALLIPAFLAAGLLPSVPASGWPAPTPEVQTVTLTGGSGTFKGDKTDVTMTFDGTRVVSLKSTDVDGLVSTLRLIDRKHPAKVTCGTEDQECGSVELKSGEKIAACVCKKVIPASGVSRIPPVISSKLLGPIQSGAAVCWESKDQSLNICYKAGPTPGIAPRTREHILLARQVGVP